MNHISDSEFQEMKQLKELINHNPACVVPSDLEKFTRYFVRSLGACGREPIKK